MTAGMDMCTQCKSTRLVRIYAKVSDCFGAAMDVNDGTTYGRPAEHHGYVPDDMGIGGGDYLDIEYCLTCGQIQANPDDGPVFPLPPCKLETETDEEA